MFAAVFALMTGAARGLRQWAREARPGALQSTAGNLRDSAGE
jgi:hypothetical protein